MRKDLILLVDENPEDAFLIQLALMQAEVSNPVETLTKVDDIIAYFQGTGRYGERDRYPIPALVILELRTPVVEDFAPLRWTRSHHEFDLIPIVVLSGIDIEQERQVARHLGADWFQVKPDNYQGFVDLCLEIRDRWLKPHHQLAA